MAHMIIYPFMVVYEAVHIYYTITQSSICLWIFLAKISNINVYTVTYQQFAKRNDIMTMSLYKRLYSNTWA